MRSGRQPGLAPSNLLIAELPVFEIRSSQSVGEKIRGLRGNGIPMKKNIGA
jgi:hypothetical protein